MASMQLVVALESIEMHKGPLFTGLPFVSAQYSGPVQTSSPADDEGNLAQAFFFSFDGQHELVLSAYCTGSGYGGQQSLGETQKISPEQLMDPTRQGCWRGELDFFKHTGCLLRCTGKVSVLLSFVSGKLPMPQSLSRMSDRPLPFRVGDTGSGRSSVLQSLDKVTMAQQAASRSAAATASSNADRALKARALQGASGASATVLGSCSRVQSLSLQRSRSASVARSSSALQSSQTHVRQMSPNVRVSSRGPARPLVATSAAARPLRSQAAVSRCSPSRHYDRSVRPSPTPPRSPLPAYRSGPSLTPTCSPLQEYRSGRSLTPPRSPQQEYRSGTSLTAPRSPQQQYRSGSSLTTPRSPLQGSRIACSTQVHRSADMKLPPARPLSPSHRWPSPQQRNSYFAPSALQESFPSDQSCTRSRMGHSRAAKSPTTRTSCSTTGATVAVSSSTVRTFSPTKKSSYHLNASVATPAGTASPLPNRNAVRTLSPTKTSSYQLNASLATPAGRASPLPNHNAVFQQATYVDELCKSTRFAATPQAVRPHSPQPSTSYLPTPMLASLSNRTVTPDRGRVARTSTLVNSPDAWQTFSPKGRVLSPDVALTHYPRSVTHSLLASTGMAKHQHQQPIEMNQDGIVDFVEVKQRELSGCLAALREVDKRLVTSSSMCRELLQRTDASIATLDTYALDYGTSQDRFAPTVSVSREASGSFTRTTALVGAETPPSGHRAPISFRAGSEEMAAGYPTIIAGSLMAAGYPTSPGVTVSHWFPEGSSATASLPDSPGIS